jgi:ABC-type spermidine/putrescine transport system permease subunit II
MFLSTLLAAGVPSLFIIVVACAASSVVVLPFALALERYVRRMWVWMRASLSMAVARERLVHQLLVL